MMGALIGALALLNAVPAFEPHAYYFSHCPKTGGASFFHDILRVAGGGRRGLRACGIVGSCYGAYLMTSNTSLDELRRSPWASSPLACNFATCELELVPALARAGLHPHLGTSAVRVLLMLRSPHAHVVSQFGHMRHYSPLPVDARPPLATFLRAWIARNGTDGLGWDPYNMQVRHLTMGHDERLLPNMLQSAKASVDVAFHVGVVEHYAASLCMAVSRINPRAPLLSTICVCGAGGGRLTHIDHGTKSHAVAPSLSEEEISLLDKLTSEDQPLYAHARARFFADLSWSPLPRCLLSAADPQPIPQLKVKQRAEPFNSKNTFTRPITHPLGTAAAKHG
jgi:hypothetical protein